MSEIDAIKSITRKVMTRDFDLVPTASGQGNRVHLEVWSNKLTQLPVGLELGHSTLVNFWLLRSDLPHNLPSGVTRADKEPTRDGWTDAENDGANHNLKHYRQFAGRPITRLGVRTVADAHQILNAITGSDPAGFSADERRAGAVGAAYILKINGEDHAPGGLCRPKSAEDWEGRTLQMPWRGERASSKSNKDPGDRVAVGDRLYIWTHEDRNYGHGLGLTATALADEVEAKEDELAIRLREVILLPRPFGFQILGPRVQDTVILQCMKADRGLRAWQMDATEKNCIDGLIQEFGSEAAARKAAAEAKYLSPLERAYNEELEDILQAENERKMAVVKARPGQQKFREEAMKRHGGRCVFTGVGVAAALEAAHVIPHTGNPAFEVAENCLLLRRDIHALFDANLIAIDPRTSKLVVSSALDSSRYAKSLKDRKVDHKLSREALRHQFRRFMVANDQDGDGHVGD
ncbi:HNH endonuclease [Sedimentimonas flavescens]|uniref:HNH endonuclease n=1 Tax=Sedimentimonas flavescens TaxID=2851012 RepID=UPI0021A4EF40|nr:HNH endonuclease signature motif containing protein [Sedimentimonas flavescens]MCT2538767.1 HNH endonuclease [Sedimentimonas flavescens]